MQEGVDGTKERHDQNGGARYKIHENSEGTSPSLRSARGFREPPDRIHFVFHGSVCLVRDHDEITIR